MTVGNEKMFHRVEEIDRMYGPLDPRMKSLLWLCYSMARVDAILEAEQMENDGPERLI